MATSGRVKGWRDLLASNNIVPVAFDRQNAESEISTPFNLNIKLIDGLIPQVRLAFLRRIDIFASDNVSY